jgi:hypothetical protein
MEHGGTAKRTIIKEGAFKHQRSKKKHGRFAQRTKGGRVRRVVRYPERPFMQPALEKSKQQLPGLWRNSVRQGTVSTKG